MVVKGKLNRTAEAILGVRFLNNDPLFWVGLQRRKRRTGIHKMSIPRPASQRRKPSGPRPESLMAAKPSGVASFTARTAVRKIWARASHSAWASGGRAPATSAVAGARGGGLTGPCMWLFYLVPFFLIFFPTWVFGVQFLELFLFKAKQGWDVRLQMELNGFKTNPNKAARSEPKSASERRGLHRMAFLGWKGRPKRRTTSKSDRPL